MEKAVNDVWSRGYGREERSDMEMFELKEVEWKRMEERKNEEKKLRQIINCINFK